MDKTKIEELAVDVVNRLARIRGVAALDPALIAAIIAGIVQVIQAWGESCGPLGGERFSETVRRVGPIRRVIAIRKISNTLWHHRILSLRARDVYDASVEAMNAKDAVWLDEMATEPQLPNWGI